MTIILPIQPNLPLNVTFIFKKIEKVFLMLEKNKPTSHWETIRTQDMFKRVWKLVEHALVVLWEHVYAA